MEFRNLMTTVKGTIRDAKRLFTFYSDDLLHSATVIGVLSDREVAPLPRDLFTSDSAAPVFQPGDALAAAENLVRAEPNPVWRVSLYDLTFGSAEAMPNVPGAQLLVPDADFSEGPSADTFWDNPLTLDGRDPFEAAFWLENWNLRAPAAILRVGDTNLTGTAMRDSDRERRARMFWEWASPSAQKLLAQYRVALALHPTFAEYAPHMGGDPLEDPTYAGARATLEAMPTTRYMQRVTDHLCPADVDIVGGGSATEVLLPTSLLNNGQAKKFRGSLIRGAVLNPTSHLADSYFKWLRGILTSVPTFSVAHQEWQAMLPGAPRVTGMPTKVDPGLARKRAHTAPIAYHTDGYGAAPPLSLDQEPYAVFVTTAQMAETWTPKDEYVQKPREVLYVPPRSDLHEWAVTSVSDPTILALEPPDDLMTEATRLPLARTTFVRTYYVEPEAVFGDANTPDKLHPAGTPIYRIPRRVADRNGVQFTMGEIVVESYVLTDEFGTPLLAPTDIQRPIELLDVTDLKLRFVKAPLGGTKTRAELDAATEKASDLNRERVWRNRYIARSGAEPSVLANPREATG